MPGADDLQGCRVLVTRPGTQAAGLCERIEQAGGRALHLPALVIEAINDPVARQRCRAAADYDWLIFISRNAVEHAQTCLSLPLPASLKVAAIGQATATSLDVAGITVHLVAGGAGNSESLLTELGESDRTGQRFLILRGVNGRERLAEGLRRCGAEVDYADLYRRVRPRKTGAELARQLDAGIDILTVTSGEALENLLAMAADADREITHLPLVVMSERLVSLARERGFTDTVIIATQTSDQGVVEAIRQWRETAVTE